MTAYHGYAQLIFFAQETDETGVTHEYQSKVANKVVEDQPTHFYFVVYQLFVLRCERVH